MENSEKFTVKLAKDIWNTAIRILGDIKIFKFPFFLVYDPGSYLIKGRQMREIMQKVRPGDILVRGFNNYLDGKLIPGTFSHVALYLGTIKPEDEQFIETEKGRDVFSSGKGMVIHAMMEGVKLDDILDFGRCDHLAILRFPGSMQRNDRYVESEQEHHHCTDNEKAIFSKLVAGESVKLKDVFPVIYQKSLSQLGKEYDSWFDFRDDHEVSCTEFVERCICCLEPYHGIKPTVRKFHFIEKEYLAPDDFVKSPLKLIWTSEVGETKVKD
ncbi:MAG: hypothetical protein HQK83_04070 [Fibrobacteria bacterium]|nr:hypothetical protein [Fibrobacteria bacterium]